MGGCIAVRVRVVYMDTTWQQRRQAEGNPRLGGRVGWGRVMPRTSHSSALASDVDAVTAAGESHRCCPSTVALIV